MLNKIIMFFSRAVLDMLGLPKPFYLQFYFLIFPILPWVAPCNKFTGEENFPSLIKIEFNTCSSVFYHTLYIKILRKATSENGFPNFGYELLNPD